MPPRGLPGNANLEQLKKGAKSFQRAVRAGDAAAAEVVREFHPRLPNAQPGSPELNSFTRTNAQLVIARQFEFSSWPKLKAHLRAIERCPDPLVRAAEQNNYDAVALLIELGFDVNARSRTAPLHEAAMRGNLPVIRLLLDHGADPNIHDTGYDATPAGWAEHHGQREAQQLLKALEQASPATTSTEAGAATATQPGAAMRTVTAAFAAMSEGRFDELESMFAADIDWQGLHDDDGQIPSCHGRAQALERMRIGLLANREVSVSAFVEAGDRVLAHAHRVGDDEHGPPERFLVAEVHAGQITDLCGYATEAEARDAFHAGSPPDADETTADRARTGTPRAS